MVRSEGLRLRTIAVLLLAVALAAALVALAALAGPAQARTRTVTKTFANTSAIEIPNNSDTQTNGVASPYPSNKGVSGLRRGRILDVNLILKNVSHTCLSDLDVLLVGPRGQNALVMSDVGACTLTSDVTLTLDDEAINLVPADAALLSGSYRPNDDDIVNSTDDDSLPLPAPTLSGGSALSVFDATNPNGTWQLYVEDQWAGDAGEFAGGWALTIEAKVRR